MVQCVCVCVFRGYCIWCREEDRCVDHVCQTTTHTPHACLRLLSQQALLRADRVDAACSWVCLLGPVDELRIQAPCHSNRRWDDGVPEVPLLKLHIWPQWRVFSLLSVIFLFYFPF